MHKFLFIFLFTTYFLFGQQNKSIELLIDNFDNVKESNPDSAFYYINKAKLLSISSKNDFLLSRCYSRIGLYYDSKNNLKESRKNILKALILAKKSKNYKTLSFCYNYLGLLETNKGNYNLSLKYLLQSLKTASENNLIDNQCNALNNLGNLYSLQKDTLKALKYFEDIKNISQKNNLEENLMYVYSSIAELKKRSSKTQAIYYYKKSFLLAEKLQNNFQQFSTLINFSNFYLQENENQSSQKALNYLYQAKLLAIKMKSPINLFYVYFNIGGYYYKLEKFDLAIENYQKAKQLAPKIADVEQTLNIYKALADTYKINNQFKETVLYQEKYYGLKDSIFNIEKNKAFNEIQTKYEVEKKNLKINLLSKEKLIESNKKRNVIYIGIAILLPLLFLMLFFKNRLKLQKIISLTENKLFVQEKFKLQQEQELKRILGVVQGQDDERNRIAKEIHDGVGGTLAGVKLNLSQINSIIKNEKINIIIDQLGSLFQELRTISHNLSSNFIKNKDFYILLYDLKLEYENRKEFQVEIAIFPENGFKNISETIKHQIYRIMQELLTNVSKHAKANNVFVNLTRIENSISLIFEDDGIGFGINTNHGIGIKNIEERLKTINGTIIIDKEIEKGCCFVIDINLHE